MAMLLLPDIFQSTWGVTPEPFWPKAIAAVHQKFPDFAFMAEVYWDLEWILQQQGFAYCYDKRLYDRLRDGHAAPVRGHLLAGLDYQDKLARFLENHDEPRAARARRRDLAFVPGDRRRFPVVPADRLAALACLGPSPAVSASDPPATLGPNGVRLWKSVQAQYQIVDA
jgi:hypothetical protein